MIPLLPIECQHCVVTDPPTYLENCLFNGCNSIYMLRNKGILHCSHIEVRMVAADHRRLFDACGPFYLHGLTLISQ